MPPVSTTSYLKHSTLPVINQHVPVINQVQCRNWWIDDNTEISELEYFLETLESPEVEKSKFIEVEMKFITENNFVTNDLYANINITTKSEVTHIIQELQTIDVGLGVDYNE